MSNELETWISKIGKYDLPDLPNEAVGAKVKGMLGENGIEKLYEYTVEKEETKDREAFLIYLNKILKKNISPSALNEDSTIDIEAYLGSEGLQLYKKAVLEESNSQAFRDAVFISSLNTYPGKKPPPQQVTIISGASSTGKTYSAQSLLKKMGAGQKEQNYVVSVDGGVSRECSQIRQMLLQSALSVPGCIGIRDLHKHTKGLDVKKYIEKAAKESQLNMVIPLTFSNPFDTKKMLKYLRKKEVVVHFCEVKADKTQTNLMGKFRAFLIGENKYAKDKNNIKMNNREIGCESKVYEPEHFSTGVSASYSAKLIFMRYTKKKIWTITNDLVFIKKNGDKWEKCDSKDKVSSEFIKITERDFEMWRNNSFISPRQLESEKDIVKFREYRKNNDLKGWVDYCKKEKLSSPPLIGEEKYTLTLLKKLHKLAANALKDEISGAYSRHKAKPHSDFMPFRKNQQLPQQFSKKDETTKKFSVPFGAIKLKKQNNIEHTIEVTAKNFTMDNCIDMMLDSDLFELKMPYLEGDKSTTLVHTETKGELTVNQGKEENTLEWTCDITKENNVTALYDAIKCAKTANPAVVFMIDFEDRYLINVLLKKDKTLEKFMVLLHPDGKTQSLSEGRNLKH